MLWTRRGQYIQEKLKTNIPHEQDKKKKIETEMSMNKWLNCGIFIQGKIQQWKSRKLLKNQGVSVILLLVSEI